MPRARDGAMKRGRESHEKFGINPTHQEKWRAHGYSKGTRLMMALHSRFLRGNSSPVSAWSSATCCGHSTTSRSR